MATIAVDTSILLSDEAEQYISDPKRDRRVITGFRMALEWLGVPVPDYARRKEAGRADGGRAVGLRFAADNGGVPRRTYRPPTTS